MQDGVRDPGVTGGPRSMRVLVTRDCNSWAVILPTGSRGLCAAFPAVSCRHLKPSVADLCLSMFTESTYRGNKPVGPQLSWTGVELGANSRLPSPFPRGRAGEEGRNLDNIYRWIFGDGGNKGE